MTVSSLARGSIPHHEKLTSRSGTAITRVIPHHWAGTAGGDVTLADPARQASANYLIFTDGTIKSQVPEEYRAWTTGSWEVDACSITVEVQNSTNGPEWLISDKAIASLVNLVADIARRYKWGSVPASRVRGHREFVATACPGPYLFPRLPAIAASANELLNPAVRPPATPDPGQEEDEDMARYIGSFIGGDSTTPETKRKAVIYEPTSGFYTEWSGVGSGYHTAMKDVFGTRPFNFITKLHWEQYILPQLLIQQKKRG